MIDFVRMLLNKGGVTNCVIDSGVRYFEREEDTQNNEDGIAMLPLDLSGTNTASDTGKKNLRELRKPRMSKVSAFQTLRGRF